MIVSGGSVRRNFSGDRDVAQEYVGAGNTQMLILKNMMQLGGLQQMARTIDYPGGVKVKVACVFGQEYVSIYVPPAAERVVVADEPEEVVTNVFDPEEVGKLIRAEFDDEVRMANVAYGTFTKLVPGIPKIFIGGSRFGSGTVGNHPVSWSTDLGYRTLGLRNNVFTGVETRGYVLGMSPDGQFPVGVVEVRYPITVTITNPFDGRDNVTQTLVYHSVAAVWRSGTGDADLIAWTRMSDRRNGEGSPGSPHTFAHQMPVSGGDVFGDEDGSSGFRWNGRSGGGRSRATVTPVRHTADSPVLYTSPDGRAQVQGSRYRVGSGAWVSWGGSADNASCIVHIPQPDTTTTTQFTMY